MSEKIVQLNEEVIKGEIRGLVRGSVEETLNGLLEVEIEKLTQVHGMSATSKGKGIAVDTTAEIKRRAQERSSSKCRV